MEATIPRVVEVDWAGLPGDMLRCIGELLSVTGRICFRAVCRPWRAAVLLEASAMPPPWLVIPRVRGWSDSFTFLSVPTMKAFRWTPPGGARVRCVGSNDGWLAVVTLGDDGRIRISLVNPLTDARVDLPVSAGEVVGTLSQESEEIILDNMVRKVAFSPSPREQDYAVAMVCCCGLGVAYTRAGSEGWCGFADLPHVRSRESTEHQLDVAYHDGKFYYLTLCGQVWVVDMAAQSPAPEPLAKFAFPEPSLSQRRRGHHLAFSGDYALHVVWSRSKGDGTSSASGLEMLARRYDPGSSTWTRATSLGGRAFLIGDRNQSLSMPVDGGGAPWLKADSVCFANIAVCSHLAERGRGGGVWVFDVVTGEINRPTSEEAVISDSKLQLGLDLDWAKSVWFMPRMR